MGEVEVSIPRRMLWDFEDFARRRSTALTEKAASLRKKSPGRSNTEARAAEWWAMADRLLQELQRNA
jgi:hypothetical protein